MSQATVQFIEIAREFHATLQRTQGVGEIAINLADALERKEITQEQYDELMRELQ